MSKQLTLSATLSTAAMAVLALFMTLGDGERGRGATAHGSIASVLLRG